MSDEDYLENKELLEAKRDEAMQAHLDDTNDMKQIEFGVADMAQEKKDKEKAKETGEKPKKKGGKPF